MDLLEAAVKMGEEERVVELLGGDIRTEAADFINLLGTAGSESVYEHLLSVIQEEEEYVEYCFGQALLNKYNAVKEKQEDAEKKWLKISLDILNKNEYFAPYLRDDGSTAPVWKQGHALHYAADMWCPEVVQQLLNIIKSKHADKPDDLFEAVSARHDDKTPLIIAVRKADLETTKILVSFEPRLLYERWHSSKDTPLHAAIEYFSRNDDSVWPPIEARHAIVEWIAEYDPNTLCESNESIAKLPWGPPSRYAESIVARPKRLEPELQKLREKLKDLIFRNLDEAAKVDQALYRTGDERKLHELDLSDFDYQDAAHRKCNFAQFVDNFQPKKGLDFDSVLIRVQLPDMSKALHQEGAAEIAKLLNKLRKRKEEGGFGVKRIVNLNAWDNPFHPISDRVIAVLVDVFKVEKLNWYKYDLDLDALKRYGAHLRKLWLYSSCNWGTLFHWTSEDGFLNSGHFPHLEEVHIIIVDTDGKGKTQARQSLVDRVNGRIKRNNIRTYVTVEEAHRPISYVTSEDKTASERFFGTFASTHKFLESMEKKETLKPELRLPQRRIKIAIIDNGIDKWQDTISENIKHGVSYASRVDGKLLPWFTAAHAHGTHMASLIRKINPYCELYVFRVSSLREGMDPKRAIEAIKAASEAGVDVMNLSWTFDHYSEDLRNAIINATSLSNRNRALIFCSTSDEPHYTGAVYPADFNSTISVCAADSRGRRRAESRKSGDLMILGEGINADGPSYFKQSQDSVSGSSVATALATGIASVLLVYAMCAAPGKDEWQHFKERNIMLELFRKHMAPYQYMGDNYTGSYRFFEDNYVDPYRLFGKKLQSGMEKEWRHIFDSSNYRRVK